MEVALKREGVWGCPDGWTFGIMAVNKANEWYEITQCPRPIHRRPAKDEEGWQECQNCSLNPKNILKTKREKQIPVQEGKQLG
jgi:hypothetical protein